MSLKKDWARHQTDLNCWRHHRILHTHKWSTVTKQKLTWEGDLHGDRDSGFGTVFSLPQFAFFGLQGAIFYLLSAALALTNFGSCT